MGVILTVLVIIITQSSAQTIKGCVNNKTGALRIATSCTKSETAISWNQTGPVGPQGPPGPNTLAIALLRWYDANKTASFAVGGNPNGIAFNGANIWVANGSDNTVSKLRPSDGAVLVGSIPVETTPASMAFDGANIWVGNYTSGTVTKLQASDGAVLGSFPSGTGPMGVAFDGANIWVTNYGDNTVTKF